MRVVLTDGTELPCTNFKAIESGVLLTKDKKRKKVIGFVPHREVKYVVPDDFEVDESNEDDDIVSDEADEPGSEASPALDGYGESGDPTAVDIEDGTSLEAGTDERRGHTSDGASRADEEIPPTDDGDLRRLGGLGSTYADRLQVAGYRTLSDVAAADPIAIAEAASVPPGRGRRWVDAAIRIRAETLSDDRDGGVDGDGGDASHDRTAEGAEEVDEETANEAAESTEREGREDGGDSDGTGSNGTESSEDEGGEDDTDESDGR